MKDKDREFFILLDDILSDSGNKYQTIVKIAAKIKEQLELTGEGDATIITKILNELKQKKDEKNSSGSNR